MPGLAPEARRPFKPPHVPGRVLARLPKGHSLSLEAVSYTHLGAGGEESALFANSLQRMYTMYAERRGFGTEVMNRNETELGGCKEVSFMVTGDGAYSRFKFESGVHLSLIHI